MNMRKLVAVALAAYLMASLVSCTDAEPGEIGLNVSNNGQVQSCNILVFNEKGAQIQQEHTDQNGVAFVKKLPPGTYTLKFSGHDNVMYPAVRTVEVEAGGSAYLKVDLNQATDPAAAPAT
jgi:hypothetical protein